MSAFEVVNNDASNLTVNNYPGSCMGVILNGFYSWAVERREPELVSIYSKLLAASAPRPKMGTIGSVILTKDQLWFMHPLLIKAGWKLVAKNIKNYSHYCYMYVCGNTHEDKPNQAEVASLEFTQEEIKDIERYNRCKLIDIKFLDKYKFEVKVTSRNGLSDVQWKEATGYIVDVRNAKQGISAVMIPNAIAGTSIASTKVFVPLPPGEKSTDIEEVTISSVKVGK